MKEKFIGLVDYMHPYRGEVELVARYDDGTTEVLLHEKNLIVNDGKETMALLLGNGAGAEPVSQIRFGTGGLLDPQGDPTQERVPQITETDLAEPIVDGNLDPIYFPVSASFNPSNTVTFSATVGKSDLVNQALSEIGLFTASSKMFSIKTFGLITKKDNYLIDVNWKIIF